MASVDTIMGDFSYIFHLGLNYDITIQYRVVREDGSRAIYSKFVRGVYRGFIGEKPNRKFKFETDITKQDDSRYTLIDEKDFMNEQGRLTAIIKRTAKDLIPVEKINRFLLSSVYKLKF